MGITNENKLGSNCSGSDGATGRILTLANVALTQTAGFQVFVNGLLLTPTTDYTLSNLATSSTVTFVGAINNTDTIDVQYVQGSTTGTNYCSSTDVYNRTGLSITEVASAIVDILIDDTTAEIEMLTGRKFTDNNSVTQYFNIEREDIIGNKQTTIILDNYPIQSITSCLGLNVDGTTATTYGTLTSVQVAAGTYYTTDYWLDTSEDSLTNTDIPNGKIIFKTESFSRGTQKIKVAYTSGYGTVPVSVRALATCLAGIRCWVRYMGGSYNRIDSYNIPQQGVQKGDFYARCRNNIEVLRDESERLLDRIGRRMRVSFFATGQSR